MSRIMGLAYQKGNLLYQHRRWKDAAEQFRAELQANPRSAPALAMLAMCLLNENRLKEAHAASEQALAFGPDYAFAHFAMAHVLIRYFPQSLGERIRSKGRFDVETDNRRVRLRAASKSIQRALALAPLVPDFLYLFSHIEAALGQLKPALATAERALSIDPRHVASAHLRAMLLRQLGRDAEADAEILRLLAINPEQSDAHHARGWMMLQRGEHRLARRHFADALRLAPGNAKARIGLMCAGAARVAPLRWCIRLVLWTNLAYMRRWMLVVAIAAGICVGVYRDCGFSRSATAVLVIVQSLLLLGLVRLVMLVAHALRIRRRKRNRSGRRRKPAPSPASDAAAGELL